MDKRILDVPFTSLYYFSIIATEGNMTRASELLYKTQPALSAAMRKLEEQLGFLLFERQNNKLVLTEAGQCLLEYLNTSYGIMEDGLRAAERMAHKADGINVATSMGIIRQFAEEYAALTGKHIEVRTCDTEEIVSRLTSGRADIGVNFGQVQDVRLSNVPLMRGHYCVAISPEHPLAGKKTVTLKELSEYQLFCSNLSGTLDKVKAMFQRVRCECKLLCLDEKDVLFRAAELGLGGVVCVPMINGGKMGDKVTFLPIADSREEPYSMLLLKRGEFYSQEAIAFVNYLTERFADNQRVLEETLAQRGIARRRFVRTEVK